MVKTNNRRKKYIVVGSGSSGALFCELLSEFADVTLIEDGAYTISSRIRSNDPVDWPQCPYNHWESILRYTITQKNLMGRLLECPQGKGVGGTSNINAMIWTLGHPAVFDYSWPSGWDSRVFESAVKIAMNIVPTTLNHSLGRMSNIISSCCKQPRSDKYNYFSSIWDNNVHESYLATIYNEQRVYAGKNLKNINNIIMKLNAKALSICFDDKFENAIGVNVCHEDGSYSIEYPENGGEIILCAGAFGTPKILLSSGFLPISPPSFPISKPSIATDTGYNSPHKERIKTGQQATQKISQKYMPDLGKHLGDHVLLPLLFIGNWWESEDNNNKNNNQRSQTGIWKCNNLLTLLLFISWRCFRAFLGLYNSPLPIPKYVDKISDNNNNNNSNNNNNKSNNNKSLNELKVNKDQHSHSQSCLNGVHSWITLDVNGQLLPPDSVIPPSIQILLMDGSTMKHMSEKLLPIFPKNLSHLQPVIRYLINIYNACRPLLLIIVKALFRTAVVRELFSFIFGFAVCNVQPSSRGTITLESNASVNGVIKEQLLIDPNYLDNPTDIDVLQTGLLAVRKIILEASRKHNGLVSIELLPGPWLSFQSYVRGFAAPYYHFCGTCKMVPFDAPPLCGVVTPDLKVRGVHGLRIADSSIIPGMPTGPIAATCAAIGTIAANILSKE